MGTVPPNPSELLDSIKNKLLIKVLKKKFDYIIFDGVPINGLTDSLIMARLVDKVVIVSALKQTKIELFAKVLGVSPGDLMGWEQESNQAPEPTLDEQLEGVEFALWGEVQDLSDEEKQDILDFIKFKKSQRK